MAISDESAAELRRCIRILAPHYPPSDRAQMVLNAETYIGEGKWIPAFALDDIPRLYYPHDPASAKQLRTKMLKAVEAGELQGIDYQGPLKFLASHLCAWPDCPAIPADSPLRFWAPMLMLTSKAVSHKKASRIPDTVQDESRSNVSDEVLPYGIKSEEYRREIRRLADLAVIEHRKRNPDNTFKNEGQRPIASTIWSMIKADSDLQKTLGANRNDGTIRTHGLKGWKAKPRA